MMQKSFATQDRVALLEVLVVGPILGIAVLGLALMFSLGGTIDDGDERVAAYLVRQRMEEVRTERVDALEPSTNHRGCCHDPRLRAVLEDDFGERI